MESNSTASPKRKKIQAIIDMFIRFGNSSIITSPPYCQSEKFHQPSNPTDCSLTSKITKPSDYERQMLNQYRPDGKWDGTHLYSGGYSSALVRCVIDRNDLAQSQFVLKTNRSDVIDNEAQRLNRFKDHFQTIVIHVIAGPFYSTDQIYAGIIYEHCPSKSFYERMVVIDRMSDTCEQIDEISKSLKSFHSAIHPLLRRSARTRPGISIATVFDTTLFPNITLKYTPVSSTPKSIFSPKTEIDLANLELDNIVEIRDLEVIRVDPKQGALILNVTNEIEFAHSSCRIQLVLPAEIASIYRIGDKISSVRATVVDTRKNMILDRIISVPALKSVSWSAESCEIDLSGQISTVKNPLPVLEQFYESKRSLQIGIIHGDLNLGNIMIDEHGHFVGLIDCALAREDYVVHEFLKQEESFLNFLIDKFRRRFQNRDSVKLFLKFYHSVHLRQCHGQNYSRQLPRELHWLHEAFFLNRQQALQYLDDRQDMKEYYEGVLLYLIGSLRYPHLDKYARFFTFIAASSIAQILTTESCTIFSTVSQFQWPDLSALFRFTQPAMNFQAY